MNKYIPLEFRIWNIVYNEFEYAPSKRFLISLDGNLFDGEGSSYDECHVIQRFTGLIDRNQKKIFEGDIVKQQFDYNDDPQRMSDVRWSPNTWNVVWSDTEHRFGLEQNNPRFGKATLEHLSLHNVSNDIEVVGNIFESPKWPTLEGRLNHPLTSRKEGLQQLKDSGMTLSKEAQKELDSYD